MCLWKIFWNHVFVQIRIMTEYSIKLHFTVSENKVKVVLLVEKEVLDFLIFK